MTNNELTLKQLEKALDIEMETSDLITRLTKKSFEEEHKRRRHIKIVKFIYQPYPKIKKRSAA